jgi:hypothetical protein
MENFGGVGMKLKLFLIMLPLILVTVPLLAWSSVNVENLKMTWTANGKKDHSTWLKVDLTKTGSKFKGTAIEVSPEPEGHDLDGDPLGYNTDLFSCSGGYRRHCLVGAVTLHIQSNCKRK